MARFRDPLWYRWLVNYRDKRGRLHQTLVESTTHRDAIIAAQMSHPAGHDFTATKLSSRPL
jgi:hypothetical protein